LGEEELEVALALVACLGEQVVGVGVIEDGGQELDGAEVQLAGSHHRKHAWELAGETSGADA
jgi:hypothetical protein